MKRLICTMAVLLALCVPARADGGLSMDEAMDIILAHHGVETEIDVSGYLTLDAEAMTREAAVTAVVRSYGVYPVDEPDYMWVDEEEQDEVYRPYIDYAKCMGITVGIGDGCFAPKQSVTEWELRTMLDRADGIEPEYPLHYESPICKLLSADIQRGLSMPLHFWWTASTGRGVLSRQPQILLFWTMATRCLSSTLGGLCTREICGWR